MRDRERVLRTGRLCRRHGWNSIERLRRHLLQPCGLHVRLLWRLPHVLHGEDSVGLRLLLLLKLVLRWYGRMRGLVVDLLSLMWQF